MAHSWRIQTRPLRFVPVRPIGVTSPDLPFGFAAVPSVRSFTLPKLRTRVRFSSPALAKYLVKG